MEKMQKLPIQIMMLLGVFAGIIESILRVQAIMRSAASTAAIGYVYVPVEFCVSFLIYGFMGYLLGILIRGILNPAFRRERSFMISIVMLMIASVMFVSHAWRVIYVYQHSRYVTQVTDLQALNEVVDSLPHLSLGNYQAYILASVVLNPQTDPDLLDKVANFDTDILEMRLNSLFNLAPTNFYNRPVMRLVAESLQCRLATLAKLSHSADVYVLSDIAANPNASPELLKTLYDRAKQTPEGYPILSSLKYNPQTPIEIKESLNDVAQK